MTSAFLLAVVLSLPPSAQVVKIAADSWPTMIEMVKAEQPQAGEALWWWSPDCAPERLTADSREPSCQHATPASVRIVDDRGRNVAGAKIVWGTSEMVADIPESMLPSATTGDDGTIKLMLPDRKILFMRVAGPVLATWWQKVPASHAFISLRASESTSVTTHLQISDGSPRRGIVEVEPVSVASAADEVRSWAVSERDVVSFLPLPRMPVRYTAWSDEAAPLNGTGNTGQFPRVLQLPRGARVEGRLLAARNGLSGAVVEAVFGIPGASRGLRRRAQSDANGRFRIRGLSPGMVQITVRKPSFAAVLLMVKVDGALTMDDIVMRPGRSVTIHVVDGAGRAITGAELRTADGVHAIVDSRGIAILNGVAAGEDVQVDVRAHSYRSASAIIAAGAKGNVDVVLRRGVRVLATLFRDGGREPAGPGNVLIMNNGGKQIEPFDSSGRIDIGGLAAGTLSLEIRATGSMPFVVAERKLSDDDEVDLGEVSLPKGSGITGHLIARSSAVPISNAHIKALRRGASGPILSFVMRDWVEATSTDDGTFTVAGVQPGPQVLLFEASGFASRIVTAEVRVDAETPLDLGAIDLDRAREVIVNCTPAPRCGNEARLLLDSADFPWASVAGSMRDGTARLLPAASGTATLRLIANGRIIEERIIEISSQSDTTSIDVKLRSTSVAGAVATSGRPQSGGTVYIERGTGSSRVMPVYMESRTSDGQVASSNWLTDMPELQTAAVDAKGRFAFADVRPGAYNATYRRDGITSPPFPVSIPELDHFDFTIDLPPGEIHGRVVDAESVPVSHAVVEVHDAAGQQQVAASNAAGEFSLSGIGAGHVSLRATQGDREGGTEAEIEPPRAASVEIRLKKKEQTKSEIAVSAPNGQPLPGAVVFLLGSGGFPAGVASTDASGIATFHLSEPLIAPAAAYSPNYGWSWMNAKSIGAANGVQPAIRMSDATGALVVSSVRSANIELYTSAGIPVASAFVTLGVPVTIVPGGDVRLAGLPPGTYTLQSGAFRASAEVTAGKDARVSIR